MFGFVLAIGIVVDDAIVVVEAVQHYIDDEKISAKEATERAMKDISGPVVAIALILAAVFVPVGFIPGYCRKIVSAICHYHCYICSDLCICCTFAYAGTMYSCCFGRMHLDKSSRGLNKFFYRFNKWFARVNN